MATKNLGLVKAIFRQSSSPSRTDVLWYDTEANVLKYYDTTTLSWKPIIGRSQKMVEGNTVVSGSPSQHEIYMAIGMSPSEMGVGYRFIFKGDGDVYLVTSDGLNYHYVLMTKAV